MVASSSPLSTDFLRSAAGVSAYVHTLREAEPAIAQSSGYERCSHSREGAAKRILAYFAGAFP